MIACPRTGIGQQIPRLGNVSLQPACRPRTGHVAAQRFGAARIVDPRPYAVGSMKQIYSRYRHLTDVLPAMGYGEQQVKDLEATVNSVPCDLVLVGTPLDLGRLIRTGHPMIRVAYTLDEAAVKALDQILGKFISRAGEGRRHHEEGLPFHSGLVN